ncbi:MAG: formate/nitrite transporter family protein, partial [Bacilli bacterium]
LGLAILCGIMMYIAVEGYKRVPNDIAKVFLVIFSAMIFLMAGFEHSLANIYYFMLSGTFELKAFLYALIMLLGNAIGAIGFNLLEKAAKLKR